MKSSLLVSPTSGVALSCKKFKDEASSNDGCGIGIGYLKNVQFVTSGNHRLFHSTTVTPPPYCLEIGFVCFLATPEAWQWRRSVFFWRLVFQFRIV
jgi:hypothetical protein